MQAHVGSGCCPGSALCVALCGLPNVFHVWRAGSAAVEVVCELTVFQVLVGGHGCMMVVVGCRISAQSWLEQWRREASSPRPGSTLLRVLRPHVVGWFVVFVGGGSQSVLQCRRHINHPRSLTRGARLSRKVQGVGLCAIVPAAVAARSLCAGPCCWVQHITAPTCLCVARMVFPSVGAARVLCSVPTSHSFVLPRHVCRTCCACTYHLTLDYLQRQTALVPATSPEGTHTEPGIAAAAFMRNPPPARCAEGHAFSHSCVWV